MDDYYKGLLKAVICDNILFVFIPYYTSTYSNRLLFVLYLSNVLLYIYFYLLI